MAISFTRTVTITCDCGIAITHAIGFETRFAVQCWSCKARMLFIEARTDEWIEVLLPVADDFGETIVLPFYRLEKYAGRDLNRWLGRGTREQRFWPKIEPAPTPPALPIHWRILEPQIEQNKVIRGLADLELHQQQRFQAYEWKRENWPWAYLESHEIDLRRKLAELRRVKGVDRQKQQIGLIKRELQELDLFMRYRRAVAQDEDDCVSRFLTSDEILHLDIAAVFEDAAHLRSARRPLLAAQRDYYGSPTQSGHF